MKRKASDYQIKGILIIYDKAAGRLAAVFYDTDEKFTVNLKG